MDKGFKRGSQPNQKNKTLMNPTKIIKTKFKRKIKIKVKRKVKRPQQILPQGRGGRQLGRASRQLHSQEGSLSKKMFHNILDEKKERMRTQLVEKLNQISFGSIVKKHQFKDSFSTGKLASQPIRERGHEEKFQSLLRMILFKHRMCMNESQHDEETKNSEQLLNQTVEKINQ